MFSDDDRMFIIRTVPELLVILMVCVLVGMMAKDNGRLDMCRELGGNYTFDKRCVDPILIEMEEARFNTRNLYQTGELTWFNTTI